MKGLVSTIDIRRQIDPNFASAYEGRGLAYTANHDYDKALTDLNKAIEIDPKYADAYFSRGLAYYGKGEKIKAEADWKKAKDLGYK